MTGFGSAGAIAMCSVWIGEISSSKVLLTSKLDPPQDEEDEDGNQDDGDARANHHPHHLKRRGGRQSELQHEGYTHFKSTMGAGRRLCMILTMLVCSSSSTNDLKLSNSWRNRETERERLSSNRDPLGSGGSPSHS